MACITSADPFSWGFQIALDGYVWAVESCYLSIDLESDSACSKIPIYFGSTLLYFKSQQVGWVEYLALKAEFWLFVVNILNVAKYLKYLGALHSNVPDQ